MVWKNTCNRSGPAVFSYLDMSSKKYIALILCFVTVSAQNLVIGQNNTDSHQREKRDLGFERKDGPDEITIPLAGAGLPNLVFRDAPQQNDMVSYFTGDSHGFPVKPNPPKLGIFQLFTIPVALAYIILFRVYTTLPHFLQILLRPLVDLPFWRPDILEAIGIPLPGHPATSEHSLFSLPGISVEPPHLDVHPLFIRIIQAFFPLFTNGDFSVLGTLRALVPLPIRLLLAALPIPSGPFKFPRRFAGLLPPESAPSIVVSFRNPVVHTIKTLFPWIDLSASSKLAIPQVIPDLLRTFIPIPDLRITPGGLLGFLPKFNLRYPAYGNGPPRPDIQISRPKTKFALPYKRPSILRPLFKLLAQPFIPHWVIKPVKLPFLPPFLWPQIKFPFIPDLPLPSDSLFPALLALLLPNLPLPKLAIHPYYPPFSPLPLLLPEVDLPFFRRVHLPFLPFPIHVPTFIPKFIPRVALQAVHFPFLPFPLILPRFTVPSPDLPLSPLIKAVIFGSLLLPSAPLSSIYDWLKYLPLLLLPRIVPRLSIIPPFIFPKIDIPWIPEIPLDPIKKFLLPLILLLPGIDFPHLVIHKFFPPLWRFPIPIPELSLPGLKRVHLPFSPIYLPPLYLPRLPKPPIFYILPKLVHPIGLRFPFLWFKIHLPIPDFPVPRIMKHLLSLTMMLPSLPLGMLLLLVPFVLSFISKILRPFDLKIPVKLPHLEISFKRIPFTPIVLPDFHLSNWRTEFLPNFILHFVHIPFTPISFPFLDVKLPQILVPGLHKDIQFSLWPVPPFIFPYIPGRHGIRLGIQFIPVPFFPFLLPRLTIPSDEATPRYYVVPFPPFLIPQGPLNRFKLVHLPFLPFPIPIPTFNNGQNYGSVMVRLTPIPFPPFILPSIESKNIRFPRPHIKWPNLHIVLLPVPFPPFIIPIPSIIKPHGLLSIDLPHLETVISDNFATSIVPTIKLPRRWRDFQLSLIKILNALLPIPILDLPINLQPATLPLSGLPLPFLRPRI